MDSERRTHDYVRHGTTSLFAALNAADGTVISSIHRKHRSIEFKKFLQKIDTNVPEHLDVHVISDNYSTHKHPLVKAWNESLKPFIWTKTDEDILKSIARYLKRINGSGHESPRRTRARGLGRPCLAMARVLRELAGYRILD
ncbi:transposase [Gulosibacter molinativorax]|uniref:transposase n=1 Tax=Gulosibacter molinativorax TaxID=256821 RepID=UPI0024BEA412|nr:transposase [Gulosibacter molinativorax]